MFTTTPLQHKYLEDVSDEQRKDGFMGHVGHCLDYMRQMIVCTGDLTVEPVNVRSPENGELMATHHCRDWEMAIEWGCDGKRAQDTYPSGVSAACMSG